jgi:hypothetical protein
MRTALVVGLLALGGRAAAVDPPAEFKLPEADGKKWVERVRKAVSRDNWTVTLRGNEITVRRDKPVAVVVVRPNEPARPPGYKPKPSGEATARYVLRFAPKMSADEYDRLAAVNGESEKEYDRLHRAVGLPHKFDDFIATTPEEQERVRRFREAVAKLPRHDLPDFYTPDYSVFFLTWSDGGLSWSYPHDENVLAECQHVEQVLLKYFGMYDPRAAAGGRGYGRPLPEKRP